VGVADTAVSPHDDLQDNIASDAAPSRLFRVLRLHFVQQPRRLDAAAWPIGATTGAASFAFADTGTNPLAIAGTLTSSNAAVRPRPIAFRSFDRALDLPNAIDFIRGDGLDWGDDFLRRLGLWRLLFRDHDRFGLFRWRHRELRPRPLALSQDLGRRLWLSQTAAATTTAGPGLKRKTRCDSS
jgi:hypothetical protein